MGKAPSHSMTMQRGERLRDAMAASIVARMAEIARRRISAVGFCTDDDFKAGGFSAKAIDAHGNRARHRAAQVMARELPEAAADLRQGSTTGAIPSPVLRSEEKL